MAKSAQNLIELYETLHRMHTGSTDKGFWIKNGTDGVYIADKRLNDLLWQLQLEAYQEIADRFPPLPEGTI